MIENFITRLSTQLKSKEYHTRYPQLLDKSLKTHVLFLGPYLNATGLYRTIIPYMELNNSQTHSAIINQLIPAKENINQKAIEWHLSDEMIQWADFIVFPTTTSDLSQNIELLKKINKKPTLKFVMDIDDNYHIDIPGQDQKKATESRKNILINMAKCDIVTTTNRQLGQFYLNKLKEASLKEPIFYMMPNLMYNKCMENIQIIEKKPDKKRIGISCNRTYNSFKDLLSIKKPLAEIQKKYKDEIEIVLFGWNGRVLVNGSMKDAMQGIKTTYIEPVEIHQYFNKLANLQLDFCIIPLLDTEFNSCKSHHKLLQYSQFGIPTIVSDVLPYSEVLAPAGKSMYENGFVPSLRFKNDEELQKNIIYLIENKEFSTNLSTNLKHIVNQNFSWENRAEYICNLYK